MIPFQERMLFFESTMFFVKSKYSKPSIWTTSPNIKTLEREGKRGDRYLVSCTNEYLQLKCIYPYWTRTLWIIGHWPGGQRDVWTVPEVSTRHRPASSWDTELRLLVWIRESHLLYHSSPANENTGRDNPSVMPFLDWLINWLDIFLPPALPSCATEPSHNNYRIEENTFHRGIVTNIKNHWINSVNQLCIYFPRQ